MYTRAQAVDFWYEFDQRFLFASPPEVMDAYAAAFPDGRIDAIVDLVRDTPPGGLADAAAARAAGILTLAQLQLELIDRFFPDPADLQRAYEDFGQGVLIDSPTRRPPSQLIHMMNGAPDDWVGYHRWHAFARCAHALAPVSERWDTVDKFVALAWAIQSEADPKVDDPTNPGLTELRLNVLRAGWLNLDTAARDAAFLDYTGQFGTVDFQGSVRAPRLADFLYKRVTQLLAKAASASHPMHGGKGRFWTASEPEFLTLRVYGNNLIADPGPERGRRSALVQVLRGELPGFPRMPLNRPPMSPADIAFITTWIDLLDLLSAEAADPEQVLVLT